MATAAIVITNTSLQGGMQALDVTVTSGDTVPPISVQTAFPLSLTRNRNLVESDIKAACRQIILDAGGPTISDSDLYIF